MAKLITLTDQLQRRLEVPFPPQRIVSLVPSQTELLHYLGLEERVVGITRFCEHPAAWYRNKPRVGGTKQVNLDRIKALQPDLIIGNKEENDREQIELLAQIYPVWLSDIKTLSDALDMIQQVGQLTDTDEQAGYLVGKIRAAFAEYRPQGTIRTAYFIWRKPWMVAAADTFIHEMMREAGMHNVFSHKQRYPEISLDELIALEPARVLLSSEPYPFKEKHIKEIQSACPKAQIKLVDGALFSWYGSRLLLAPAYFAGVMR
jgi:ABC-type Fe3+-hydroxamate transport system substrate-binding protein